MTQNSNSKKVAFLTATEGVEQVELTSPWDTVKNAGHQPVLVSLGDKVQGYNHLDAADTFDVDQQVSDASVDDYAALVLPGGVANPDALRMDEQAVAFVRAFVESGKPVAAICHAPWTLVEADVVSGRRVTSFQSLQTDLRNAGAEWVDEKVVIDGNLITSRNPNDLEAFNSSLMEALEHGVAMQGA